MLVPPPDPLRLIIVTPDFSVSQQIFPAQMDEIKQLGYQRILAVRPDDEEDADEQPPRFILEQTAIKAGLRFSHIPIESGAAFPESAVRSAAHLFGAHPEKTLAFCLSGIRSLRLWALGTALAGTLAPEQIVQQAKLAGFELTQFTPHFERLAKGTEPFYVADDYANLI
ncbi:hypothetical protein MNBD_ALPHA06-428 [hydrothermal vent metagenome]|uniref:Beta-lactamase hydrolase-like protein phosphatase-like domain-containing protein n=1 Tax=hydrothermal vent metagenome TaxID=652676 RepID=A0A3B0RRA2_9ZZZZ